MNRSMNGYHGRRFLICLGVCGYYLRRELVRGGWGKAKNWLSRIRRVSSTLEMVIVESRGGWMDRG